MRVLKTLARVCVAPAALEDTLKFYERTLGKPRGLRYFHPGLGLELAEVGPVLLVSGPEAALAPVRDVRLSMSVDSLEDAVALVIDAGGRVVRPPTPVPTGRNVVVRHPDRTLVEYVELATA